MPLKLKMSSNPTDALIAADHNMDIDAADQNESANANKGGKGKHKGKLGDINMARLILSRNKSHKSSKHKKRTEVAPAPTSPLARETNAYHYKHTTHGCGHEIYEDKEGNYLARWELPDKSTTIKIADSEVAVYPWRCKTCAELGYPYHVPRDSHLINAEIAAEQVLRAAKPGDSFEEVFHEADLAAFYEAPKDDYHEEYDMSSNPSLRAPDNHLSTTSPNHNTSTNAVNEVFPSKAPSSGSTMLPTNNSSQTAAPATSQHREIIDLTSETEEVSRPGSGGSDITNSPRFSSIDSGYLSVVSQEARLNPPAMVASSFPSTAPATPPSNSPANAAMPGAASSSSSRAPVVIKTGDGLAAASMGLTLVVNGVTYPRIENGKERWYTQCPGRNNNYSRYSDLAKFDTSKGVGVAPKASRAQLEAARRYRTFVDLET
ncbi:hypothetical protein KCU77_g5733, partial [Aureobasidium melanogenum]